jgi:hypothetical protein
MTIKEYGGPKISRAKYLKQKPKAVQSEDAAAMNTGAIPSPAQTAMGPSRLPTNLFRRKMGIPINTTDRRRKKDKPPKMLKKFRNWKNG